VCSVTAAATETRWFARIHSPNPHILIARALVALLGQHAKPNATVISQERALDFELAYRRLVDAEPADA